MQLNIIVKQACVMKGNFKSIFCKNDLLAYFCTQCFKEKKVICPLEQLKQTFVTFL